MSFLGAKLEIHFNDTVTNEMGLFKSRYVLCVTVYFNRETKTKIKQLRFSCLGTTDRN